MNLIFMITVNMFKKLKLESGYLTCDLQDGKVISDVIAVWATAKYIESGSLTHWTHWRLGWPIFEKFSLSLMRLENIGEKKAHQLVEIGPL